MAKRHGLIINLNIKLKTRVMLMLQKATFLTLLSLSASYPSFADNVLHVFQAGTPAKAQEVNENFSVLKDIACEIHGSDITNKFTYTAKNAAVGTDITIKGKAFTMLKVPFIEFGSGDVYAVVFPMLKSNIASGLLQTNKASVHERICGNVDIAGYKAKIEYWPHDLSMEVRKDEDGKSMFVVKEYRQGFVFDLYIGQTEVAINENFGIEEEPPYSTTISERALDSNEADFTTFADFSEYSTTAENELIEMYDALLDYIRVEKVSP